MTYQSDSPHGDARFATYEEVRGAGLFKPKGGHLEQSAF